MTKEWDLNIYFMEDYDMKYGEYKYETTLNVNPALWMMKDGVSNVAYSNWYIRTTLEETNEIRKHYPESEYGMDWTDSLTNFLNIAPPRLHLMLATLPPSTVMDETAVHNLVG